jgi:hypothetical protein
LTLWPSAAIVFCRTIIFELGGRNMATKKKQARRDARQTDRRSKAPADRVPYKQADLSAVDLQAIADMLALAVQLAAAESESRRV